jgi:hypothetical protein
MEYPRHNNSERLTSGEDGRSPSMKTRQWMGRKLTQAVQWQTLELLEEGQPTMMRWFSFSCLLRKLMRHSILFMGLSSRPRWT